MATRIAALLVAAGRGVRAGGAVAKQYRSLAGVPVIRRALATLCRHPQIDLVQTVIGADDEGPYAEATAGLTLLPPTRGGDTRQHSVHRGLEVLASQRPDLVLVHDAARPFTSAALIDRAIAAGSSYDAAVPGVAIADTVKQVERSGLVAATLDRGTLRAIQTPQAFRYDMLLDVHRRAAAAGRADFTDDAALCEWAGIAVATFEGEAGNVKLTTAEDFRDAERRIVSELSDVRIGSGFDVHAFGEGDHVMLGGVRIAHGRGLSGHSDADVVLHALTDAVLGALADGDIGAHFPPSDPRWRGVSSDRFLAFAVERVRVRGGIVAHLDATVVCEAPRIGPHRDAMRERIAAIAGMTPARVAVKATTSEKLGFTGRGEGIAAQATATIRLPFDGAAG